MSHKILSADFADISGTTFDLTILKLASLFIFVLFKL